MQKDRKDFALNIVEAWFERQGWQPFDYQRRTWQAFDQGYNGLLNAPTGSGKTHALALPPIMNWMREHPDTYQTRQRNGLILLWLTPLRALARNLEDTLSQLTSDLGLPWRVERRTGDISNSLKQRQRRKMPEILITTPESLHVMLAHRGYGKYFNKLQAVVADEWHELLGSKRGVQTELALARISALRPEVPLWGISATIGNLEQSLEVLLGANSYGRPYTIITSGIEKKIEVESVRPDQVENFPWAGHLGIQLLDKIIPIVKESRSTLIFTNTRSQAEIWFRSLLEAEPDLAGRLALHHGSLDKDIRYWVESALRDGTLEVVVCTSSLDLGVDFSPVETVIQIGSPKGVARFMQRAGRSGHQPDAVSRIYFVPTHSLELVEAAALKSAIETGGMEQRTPVEQPADVLIQYLVTLGVSDGFDPDELYREVRRTYAYRNLDSETWRQVLQFVQYGGETLKRYDDYRKVEPGEDGLYRVTSRRIANRHRMSIGTIASDTSLQVKFLKGGRIGTMEEQFVAKLKAGDVFWFAGRNLELVKIRDLTVYVRRAKRKKGKVPRWLGGRMPLSAQLSESLRQKLEEGSGLISRGNEREKDSTFSNQQDVELKTIRPILELQERWSRMPGAGELLMEKIKTREGHHLFVYPFEGRYVHEGLSALIAHRLGRIRPISLSIAMNDYGFELLSDQDIPIEEGLERGLFDSRNLIDDIMASINDTEMARRRFREIAQIAGLVFVGFPSQSKTTKDLQMSSQILFDVFMEHDPGHLLLQQAYDEVRTYQLDESRLRDALERIKGQELVLTRPGKTTPFAFPIMVDRLRERLSTEKLIHRVQKMQMQLEKHVS